MTLAEICLLVACLLPIVCAGAAKSPGFRKSQGEGGFDNHHPRAWLASLEGWQSRAHAAQLNSFEALPIFIAGVLVAQQHHAAQHTIDALAMAFIVLRIAFIWAYVTDRAKLRSCLWSLGLVCCVAQFFVA